jgi:hypothetical protein
MENMADEISRLKSELEATTGDAMCARAERDEARADWESSEKANARLREENERLRAACKRNPSSGSCIEALSEK